MSANIKDAVKEEHTEAALRVLSEDAIAPQVDGKFMSAFVPAIKPQPCCNPGCCS